MKKFLGINFIFDRNKIYEKLKTLIENKSASYICAVNANIVVEAEKNQNYKHIINASEFNICDGSIIALLHRKLYSSQVNSYPGPDFFIDIVNECKYKSFFLGSTFEILSSLQDNLTTIDPKIKEMTFYSPPFTVVEDFNYKNIADMINRSDADIVWVSLGAPKQEEFMFRLKPYLLNSVMVGVGAAFTFYGDKKIKRAPKLMREMRLEWLYRVIKDPIKILPRQMRQLRELPALIYKEYKKVSNDENIS